MKGRFIFLIISIFLISACSGELPLEKQDFVGLWKNNSISLLITAEGSIHYEKKGGTNVTVSAPIKKFTDDKMVVGIWFITTDFKIDQSPTQENGTWFIIVDGNKLFKANERGVIQHSAFVPKSGILIKTGYHRTETFYYGITNKGFSSCV